MDRQDDQTNVYIHKSQNLVNKPKGTYEIWNVTPKALVRILHQIGDCEENIMFSILMKIYILCQINWYNLFLRIKEDRFPIFEHNLHIIAQEKDGYELQDG